LNLRITKKINYHQWGLIEYTTALAQQEVLFNELLDLKVQNRNAEDPVFTHNHFISCEHPHVYTLGKSGNEQHLLLNEELLKDKGAQYYKTNRGGDITYHGPGQLVVYPILDLENFFTDIHKYLRLLEQAVIDTCAHFGIKAGRIDGLTGVWVDFDQDDANSQPRKICAMGVKCSRWISMHGLALNVNTNLDYFNYIVPCGISDKAVTSIAHELGKPVDIHDVNKVLIEKFELLFDIEK
jgi:lipoyl(octanoyl) transferase